MASLITTVIKYVAAANGSFLSFNNAGQSELWQFGNDVAGGNKLIIKDVASSTLRMEMSTAGNTIFHFTTASKGIEVRNQNSGDVGVYLNSAGILASIRLFDPTLALRIQTNSVGSHTIVQGNNNHPLRSYNGNTSSVISGIMFAKDHGETTGTNGKWSGAIEFTTTDLGQLGNTVGPHFAFRRVSDAARVPVVIGEPVTAECAATKGYVDQTLIQVPVRQTVISGPIDANGAPNFGGTTGATSVTATGTLIVTAASGFGISGQTVSATISYVDSLLY